MSTDDLSVHIPVSISSAELSSETFTPVTCLTNKNIIEWFLSIHALTEPKPISSLVDLWDHMFIKQSIGWSYYDQTSNDLKKRLDELLVLGRLSWHDDISAASLQSLIESTDLITLLGVIRALHVRIHLAELDEAAYKVEQTPSSIGPKDLLDSKLIVHSFLQFLMKNGTSDFTNFVNDTTLRLVSTVHPNETERSTNLMHYNSVLEKYIMWKKDFESVSQLPKFSPEYRIRRENLNQLRRAIKAEIEGVWQNNFRRHSPIPVDSEARRLLERYKTIFSAYPTFMKLTKSLAKEAFWLYKATEFSEDPVWLETFVRIFKNYENTRDNKLKAIKRTCMELGQFEKIQVPRIFKPILTFSSWKGGDRDGNPFVVASFSNEIFIEQKAFVLDEYINLVQRLVDQLTISTEFLKPSDDLQKSLLSDRKIFPYINNIKPWEPYRAKMRYILEKLKNTQRLVQSVRSTAGSTTKPLLGRTLPGPIGYNEASQFQEDIEVVYRSLLSHSSKAQARSYVQDLTILVNTFGLHLTSIDFRQHSAQNFKALIEYLELNGYTSVNRLKTGTEKERQQLLLSLIGGIPVSSTDQASDPYVLSEFNPWVLPGMTKLSRDTWESLIVFQDAAATDVRSVGKFIISMCSNVSDILVILTMMKISGILHSEKGVITRCEADVTGLFETVEDLKSAPTIIRDLLSIKMIRDYIRSHRNGKITIMMGYSDSVRDGSSLASDAQVTRTSLQLTQLEADLNLAHSNESVFIGPAQSPPTSTSPEPSTSQSIIIRPIAVSPNISTSPILASSSFVSSSSTSSIQSHPPLLVPCNTQIRFVFYRGRGDTIPRGFGGSVSKAVAAQLVTTQEEDHTEQNRYLRRYSSVSSTIDHLHSLYSAHVSRQLTVLHEKTFYYQRFFDFFGRISNLSWSQLVQPSGHGDIYFGIFSKYSILPHLTKSYFASRPVARDGITYNIDTIRAIPFTMFLAQLREFTVAFYGTGSAFELGSKILQNENHTTTLALVRAYVECVKKEGWSLSDIEKDTRVTSMLRLVNSYKSFAKIESIDAVISQAHDAISPANPEAQSLDLLVGNILNLYNPVVPGIEDVAKLVVECSLNGRPVIDILREMYHNYAPFQYSIQNKETSLLIRNVKIVNLYTKDASEPEKKVLAITEAEAQLTQKWVLDILNQISLKSKTLTNDFKSPELEVLHYIQAYLLKLAKSAKTNSKSNIKDASIFIQTTILAISEALGFAG